MEKLPMELTIDILSRLPIVSLSKAKYVSKQWNSIVKSHYFATKHLSCNNNKPALILHFSNVFLEPNKKTFTIPSKPTHKPIYDLFLLDLINTSGPHSYLPLLSKFYPSQLNYTIIGSANGILCLVNWSTSSPLTFYLYNPMLNKYLTIPPNPEWWPHLHWYKCFTGFAHDPSTGDYKLLMLFYSRKHNIGEAANVVSMSQVCTIEVDDTGFVVGSWRSIENPPYELVHSNNGCFSNGRLHWVADYEHDSECIVSFDVQDEKFGVLLSPVWDSICHNKRHVTVLGGHLCMFGKFGKYFEESLDIWVMREYGREESWVKEYNVTKNSYTGRRHMEYYYPKCVLDDGKILIYNCFGEFLSYDRSKDVLQEYEVNGSKTTMGFRNKEIISYTCSIIPLVR